MIGNSRSISPILPAASLLLKLPVEGVTVGGVQACQPAGRAEKSTTALTRPETTALTLPRSQFAYTILPLSVWSGFGTGNDYQEWDFAVAYTFEAGTVFFAPDIIFDTSRASSSMSIPKKPETADHEHHETRHIRAWRSIHASSSTTTQRQGTRIALMQTSCFSCWAPRRFRMSARTCSSAAT